MTRAQFEQEVRDNQEPLRRFLLNLCSGNSSLSDDIAQEAFIKAYLNLNSFGGKSKFSTWLFKIAYNCFCDNKRVSNKYRSIDIDDVKICSEEGSVAEQNIENNQLYEAISKLGYNEKICTLLFYMEDKSIKEIGIITGIKENTVKSHLSRAKSNLEQHLKQIGYER